MRVKIRKQDVAVMLDRLGVNPQNVFFMREKYLIDGEGEGEKVVAEAIFGIRRKIVDHGGELIGNVFILNKAGVVEVKRIRWNKEKKEWEGIDENEKKRILMVMI